MASEFLFVADIGATNARFALADGKGRLEQTVVIPTADLGDGRAFHAQVSDLLAVSEFARGCVALAGPVRAGAGRITNGTLALEQAALSLDFGCDVMLANDFYALAHGVPSFTELAQVGGNAPLPGVKAVLGAGSGLGMSMLVPQEPQQYPQDGHPGWQVLASEGGYADLACTNELEQAVYQILQQRFSHVCWETVLSGRGLVNLYQALAQIWGYPIDEVTPEWISQQGVDAQIPLCHQTLDMFFGFLGAAAGNLALTTYAVGGVYIGGGIVPQLQAFARTSSMRRRFEERGSLTRLVRAMPMFLVLDTHPGLRGALALLRSATPDST